VLQCPSRWRPGTVRREVKESAMREGILCERVFGGEEGECWKEKGGLWTVPFWVSKRRREGSATVGCA